jgi:hypothetical protein
MNKEIILTLRRKYNHICINHQDYCNDYDFFNKRDSFSITMKDITDTLDNVDKGLYSWYYGMGIWVSKDVFAGHLKVFSDSNSTPVNSSSSIELGWSPPLPIEYYDRVGKYLKNKAFW